MNMATGNVLGTFFEKEEGRTYVCNEGNISVDTGYSTINGAKQKFFKFASPILAESFLEFDLTDDLCVKGATTVATHMTQYEAEFPSGAFPQQAITNGSYKRYVTAFKLRKGEMQLPLADNNKAIAVGDYLAITTYNDGVDKYTGESHFVQALESKTANEGGYIIVNMIEDKIPVAA